MADDNQENKYNFSSMDGTYLPLGLMDDQSHVNECKTLDDNDTLTDMQNTEHDDIVTSNINNNDDSSPKHSSVLKTHDQDNYDTENSSTGVLDRNSGAEAVDISGANEEGVDIEQFHEAEAGDDYMETRLDVEGGSGVAEYNTNTENNSVLAEGTENIEPEGIVNAELGLEVAEISTDNDAEHNEKDSNYNADNIPEHIGDDLDDGILIHPEGTEEGIDSVLDDEMADKEGLEDSAVANSDEQDYNKFDEYVEDQSDKKDHDSSKDITSEVDHGEATGNEMETDVTRQESLDEAAGYGILSAVEESAIDSLAGIDEDEEPGGNSEDLDDISAKSACKSEGPGSNSDTTGSGKVTIAGNKTTGSGNSLSGKEECKQKEGEGEKKTPEENKDAEEEKKVPPKELMNIITDPERESRYKYIFRSARFFGMKSGNFENIELAKRFCVWSTPPFNEVRLNQAYRECSNVILVFSVQESGRFQGFARLSGPSERANPPVPWVLPPGFKGRAFSTVFHLDWICRTELGFALVQQLLNPWNQNKPVRMGRDGQEIEPNVGETLCRMFPADPYVDLHAVARLSKQALRAASGKVKDRGENSSRSGGQRLPPPPHPHMPTGPLGPRHMIPQPLMGLRPGGPQPLMAPPHMMPGGQPPRQQRFALPPPAALLDPASMRRARMPQDLGQRDLQGGSRDNGFHGDGPPRDGFHGDGPLRDGFRDNGPPRDGFRGDGCSHGDRMRRNSYGEHQEDMSSIATNARSDMFGLAYSLRGL